MEEETCLDCHMCPPDDEWWDADEREDDD